MMIILRFPRHAGKLTPAAYQHENSTLIGYADLRLYLQSIP